MISKARRAWAYGPEAAEPSGVPADRRPHEDLIADADRP